MLKVKKIISGFLTLALACSVVSLAGCSKEEAQVGKIVDGVYVPGGDLDIEVWNTQGSDYTPLPEAKDNVVSAWLYEKTKVNVVSQYGNDGGQWDTKLARLVAGDNMPHIVLCGAGQGPAHFKKLADANQLLEITDDMLNTYAPNLVKRIPQEYLDAFKVNGKLYGIPFELYPDEKSNPGISEEMQKKIVDYKIGADSDEQMALWIRDDILKKIYPEAKSWDELEKLAKEKNMPIADECFDIPIKTKDEYVDFLTKVKNLNLKVDGDPVYAYGYSGGDNWEALTYIGAGMMGYEPYNYCAAWNDKKQEITVPLVNDICKEAMKIQNKLLRDNVIDQESLVHTTDAYKEKVYAGKYAIISAAYAGGAAKINASLEKNNAKFRYRPFTVQIPNDADYEPTKARKTWNGALCFTKKLSEDGLIQMLNWLNIQFSDEFEEVIWWGPKDAGLYKENDDGTRTYTDERFNKRFLEGDVSALPDSDGRGIRGYIPFGATAVKPEYSKYSPEVYNNKFSMSVYNAVVKFSEDSPHAIKKVGPDSNIWASCYASNDNVVKIWAEREKWENAFKISLTASSDADFENKWKDAVATINGVADVGEMQKEMTELAKEELKLTEN